MNMSNEKVIEIVKEIQMGNNEGSDIGGKVVNQIVNQIVNSIVRKYNYKFSAVWDVDDYKQDVLTIVLKSINNYDECKGTFQNWLWSIAKNVYKSNYKKEKKKSGNVPMLKEGEDGEEVNVIDFHYFSKSSESEVIAQEICGKVREGLECLKEKQKRAIVLRYLEGYKTFEVAEIMGCKAEDISRWLNRGIGKLRKSAEMEELWADMDYDR